MSLLKSILFPVIFLLVSASTFSQEGDKKTGWFFEGKATGVWTGGNSQTVTYGVGATVKHLWERSELRFDALGTQTESGITTRSAVGTTESYEVTEDTRIEKTAELFYVRGRYDHSFSDHLYALAGVDWLRNKFAGIDSRTLFALGLGNTWVKQDDIRFKTDYSFTYTFQSDVVENPFSKTNFPGVRFSYDFWAKLSSSTDFESLFIADWNLDNTDDIRFDMVNSLPVAISEVFTLKPSLQLLWRNDPALAEIDLFSPGGTATGSKVLVPLEKLDTIFSLALVVKL